MSKSMSNEQEHEHEHEHAYPKHTMTPIDTPNTLDSQGGQSPEFRQTHWSLVRRAAGLDSPESREALETLCRAYWFPIYAFIRRQGRPPHDAQDLTQEFFV